MRECKYCKVKFEPKHGNSKFCTPDCFALSNRQYKDTWRKEHTQVESKYVHNGYRAFLNIKARCSNPNNRLFNDYGARGILLKISQEEFMEIYFKTAKCELCGVHLNDINRNARNGRSLDRIDSSKSYEKDNLRILCRSCNSSQAFKRRSLRA